MASSSSSRQLSSSPPVRRSVRSRNSTSHATAAETSRRHVARFSSSPCQCRSWWDAGRARRRPLSSQAALIASSVFLAGVGVLLITRPDSIQRVSKHASPASSSPTSFVSRAGDQLRQESAWAAFMRNLAAFAASSENSASTVGQNIKDMVIPEWVRPLGGYVQKLQRELTLSPNSVAEDIRHDARDPAVNPEIRWPAMVRVSQELCVEEKEFRQRRKQAVARALARYLDLPADDVHPDDVPCIAMVGSGGGLRALVAGTGSLLAAKEAGLFDCVTYTAGVSGSCWLQALYNSTLTGQRFEKLVDHLKARLGVHIAYPPVALTSLISAPTNKFLLRGFVEKLQGDQDAEYGLVDVYGLLLAARLLVPKGDLGVDDNNLRISHQRHLLTAGENPMPIYTAVRHEIPIDETSSLAERATNRPSEATKEQAKNDAWFQWFEITPYEFFCEEFTAGIPTWAMGRKFKNGYDVPDQGLRVPELKLSLLLGIFGSAFCATLSHYYKEIRPLVQGLTVLGGLDGLIEGRSDDLSKVHPIDPAEIPNFAYGMEGRLPKNTPQSVYKSSHLQLMDAGMSNNLPIYPLLRPGRDVDILIAFDASADVKQDDWLSVADGYARQRGVKGWPIGIGWPKETESPEQAALDIEQAEATTPEEAASKLDQAKAKPHKPQDLGYCTVWVGTTEEREFDAAHHATPPSKIVEEDWELMTPHAGITVVYFPQLANPKVAGIDPMTSDFMSTWNFVYTPAQVDKVVALSRANFDEGRERTRRVVRAVYERKKEARERLEARTELDRWRRRARLGLVSDLDEGDIFS